MATVSRRVRVLLAAVALLAMGLLPACYTLFRHPRLQQLDYRRPASTRCQTCHAAAELWRFTHPPAVPAHPDPWGDFYNTPWWFERHWDMAGADSAGTGEEPSR